MQAVEELSPMSGWRAVVLVAAIATMLGCQGDGPDTIPEPGNLGAPSLPAGAVADATAVYAVVIGAGEAGGECRRFHRFEPDGSVDAVSVCSGRPAMEEAADPAIWERRPDVGGRARGDYVITDGVIVMRTVRWDPLAEEFVLDSVRARPCGSELRFVRGDGDRDSGIDAVLVAGAPLRGACVPSSTG